MKVIFQKSKLNGVIDIIPSKSYLHRIIILCALSDGKNIIKNVVYSNDIKATISCVKIIGAKVKLFKNYIEIEGIFYIFRTIENFKNKNFCPVFDCSESASTLRFLIPISIFLFNKCIFVGEKNLFKRPLNVYEKLFKKYNIKYTLEEKKLIIYNSYDFSDNYFELDGSVSSQFVTGMMLLLAFQKQKKYLCIKRPFTSINYILITIKLLIDLNVDISVSFFKSSSYIKIDENFLYSENIIKMFSENKNIIFEIKGYGFFKNKNYFVEADYSNSALYFALNEMGHNIKINNLNKNSLQGDKISLNIFRQISLGMDFIFDLSNTLDLAPVLFVFSFLMGKSETKFCNIKNLQMKESNRIDGICSQIKKIGGEYKFSDNILIIKKLNIKDNNEINNRFFIFDSFFDHRIVMAFTIFCLTFGGCITNAEAVNKSYPNFFDDLRILGAKFDLAD